MLSTLDLRLTQTIGMPYYRATRRGTLHDRCAYLVHVVKEFGEKGKKLKILDVGCGSGLGLYYLSQKVPDQVESYLGIDLSTERLRPRFEKEPLPHDFTDVDLDTEWSYGQFDIVWCAEVIEHLIDDTGLFRKMARSLAPGGVLVITTPSQTNRELYGAQIPSYLSISSSQDGGHVRVGYTEESMRALTDGTPYTMVRADAVTRCDLKYVKRHEEWPRAMRLANNTLETLSRSKADRYAIAPRNFEDYVSITGIYRKA